MAYSDFYARFYIRRQKIAAALAAVWSFYPSRWYVLSAGLLQIIAWWQAIFIYRHLSGDLLVLHYNVDLGIDLVGDPVRIFIYPLIGLVILMLNFLLAAAYHRQQNGRTFTHLFLAAATLFNAFLSLAILAIYLINFR